MATKKSDLYSSLWASCDELRGGMDASQYKDYVRFMLFIKHVSDKYGDSDDFAPPVTIPKGPSFRDMIALKGKPWIGDKINTQVIQPLIEANIRLARSDFPDFNDPNKLGEGQAMVDRLTNLIATFQKPELDFSRNRAENDDILGDACEYLMRHFASESGKSKGQFYTPSEVSRIMAKVIGISPKNAKASTPAYDPTCGSGSLLLKVAAEAVIRTRFVRSGYPKGIIGLPANLFYGSGIPACVLVIAKENAPARKGTFMIDASKGFIKDGNKNRLRERDLHQIVDVFTNAEEHPGYSRLVPHDEIEKNDFNLNLPRYIDTQGAEDIQDIGGHLHGGIPTRDIDALGDYWRICPALRAALFKPNRPGYHDLLVEAARLKPTIHGHPQFATFIAGLESHFQTWRKSAAASLRKLKPGFHPKEVIRDLSEHLLAYAEIQTLVVDDKWLTTLSAAVQSELDRVSQTLTSRIRLLADRYAAPLPQIVDEVAALAAKVDGHLKKMGVVHY